MKFYATHIIIGLAVLGLGFVFVGCGEDEEGPTVPEVDYLPQTFSLAVCNGALDNGRADNYGYSHNGNTTITLDWNATVGTGNTLPVTYIYNEYPLIDGGPTEDSIPGAGDGDAHIWNQAEWTTIPLAPQYGDGGVTSVRAKAVYTYVNPPRIWFLLNWDDPVDYPNAEMPYNSGYFGNCWYNTGLDDNFGGFRNEHEDPEYNGISWDHNEDWVAFMWDTWNKVGDDTNFEFVSQTSGFQSNGCAVTCHVDDVNHPHYTNGAGEYVDVWMWSATRTNYTSTEADWLSRTNDPAPIFDCYLDSVGMDWGPGDQNMYYVDGPYINEDDPSQGREWYAGDTIEWYQFDTGLYAYILNGVYHHGTEQSPDYMSENDPGDNQAYFWNSEFLFGFQSEFPSSSWKAEDKIGGYVNRPGLGGAADVGARGSYDLNTGQWMLELGRNIGSYDKINNTEDCLLGIYEAHPGE